MKKLLKNLSTFTIILMILSLIIPTNIVASTSVEEDQNKTDRKLDSKLLETYKDEEFVKYLVIMEEQTDTQAVSEKEMNQLDSSYSSKEREEKVQQAIVSELQSQAKTTQEGVLSYIENDGKNIQDYQSYFIMNGLAVTGTKQSAQEIASLPEVKSVILDGIQKLPTLEGNETADDIEWNIDQIGAPDTWETGVTGEGTVVANIDSGVDGDHPAVKENYRGYNADDPDNPSHEFNWYDPVSGRESPMDSDDHGTHTMGTMIGEEGDSNQIGVAPDAEWISARAFWLGEGHDSDIIDAAEWVLAPTDDNGKPHPEKAPDVVNNSWGGSPINNDWFLPMIEAWRSAGIVPVFSVGNTGLFQDANPGTASAPGNYKEVIAVGATDEEDQLADFSLRGPSEEGVTKPDLTAPGVSIRSSIPGESFDEFDYDISNGTSMAAPHVAGVISLMKDADPDLTVEKIETILKLTAISTTDEDYDESPNNGYGYGMLSAYDAVESVQKGVGTINGQVTASGEDSEDPTYEHDPREVVFKEQDESFSIQAMDNISVNSVTLTIQIDGEPEETYTANRVDGDHLKGNYETTIPSDDLVGDELEYWWTIEDFSGNKTETDSYTVTIEESVTTGYLEDFEAHPDGWYSYGTNDSWEWGVPEYGPESAASGDKVMGTQLRGQYEANSDMTLMMPPVFVEDNTILRFNNWYKLTYLGQDTGTVFISVDGESWEPLHQVRQENDHWHEIGLDLSDYAGEKVQIAFNLETADNENDGWYIDDVQLTKDDSNITTSELFAEDISLNLPDEDHSTLDPSSEADHENNLTDEDILPVNADITVEETGWETKTNLQNGEFTIHHEPGDYELNIDAYGFETETVSITLDEKGTVSPQVELTPLPEQTVSGSISSITGEPIEDATVFLLEDENSEPVTSSEDGSYQLNAYEGTYTLKIYADGYYGKTESITVEAHENLEIDETLEPFTNPEPSEIKYDNGSYGNNIAFGKEGNGFAVKMSLDEDETEAMVTGAKLQFWADHVPIPGGDDIMISVYDSTGEEGAPGNKLAGPIEAKAKRDLDQWTEVDLSHLGIVVEDDFYIAYHQADDLPYIPGFVTDGDSANYAERSWDYIGGEWFQADDSSGNYMIRADVAYGDEVEVTEPVITSPQSKTITNQEDIDIEGTAMPETTLQLKNNGEVVDSTEVEDDGEFTIPATLVEGDNELGVTSLIDDEPVVESDTVSVTLDTEDPELTIENPEDEETIDTEKLVVDGFVEDDHLDKVEVNGEEATVNENGQYSLEISVEEGEQMIEVVASDEAGNSTRKEVTVLVNFDEGDDPITIENVTPEEDVFLKTGNSVKITFDSEPGLNATYMIQTSSTDNTPENVVVPPLEMPLMEMSEGHYVGYWTVPANLEASVGTIEVTASDESNNEASKEAEGKLFINTEE